jgi:phospholipase C
VTAEDRLKQIKHIVVVMMENRSFDHMLGYLGRNPDSDVRGLQGEHYNVGPDGRRHDAFELKPNEKNFQRAGEALKKRLDPCHSPQCVATQLSEGSTGRPNGGFVDNFVNSRKEGDELSAPEEAIPMGFYSGESLPLYDHLADQYCVIDAWHASIPGDTWPNRLYAIAGREGPRVKWWEGSWLLDRLTHLPFVEKLRGMPLYDVVAFTRHLKDDQWRWYSHDPASLRAVDGAYRDLEKPKAGNFGYFDRKKVSFITEALQGGIVGDDSFLGDAAHNRLRQVSWIDPNFIDVSVLDPHSNDDHPPADILAGQAFVLDVYNALRKTRDWDDTLLVITYDEHGGFYDHEPPPGVSDHPDYKTLGVRVPTLVVGPRVKRFVCHEFEDEEPWEHTALIRTILHAFADRPLQAIEAMASAGASRVKERRAHLGYVLEDAPRTDIDSPESAEAEIEAWRARAREARLAAGPEQPSLAPDGAGQPLVLTEFQDEWTQFAIAMRSAGLPPGP